MSEYRQLILERVVSESDSAKSFYLVPQDGMPLAPFRPGQHLQFRVQLPGRPRPVSRFYTISDISNGRYYRLTIKKEPSPRSQPDAPPGAVSGYFHEVLCVGDILEAKPPSGDFFLDHEDRHPVVLIAGGIGVTPLLSMVNAVAKHQLERDVYFLYAVRHGGDHAFKRHLQNIAGEYSNIHLHVCYDEPREEDTLGIDYDLCGRIDLDVLKHFLPELQMPYYICGPGLMMDSVVSTLKSTGVSEQQILTESFGPSTIAYSAENVTNSEKTEDDVMVSFSRSGKSILWDPGYESLLQFAEDHGVEISAGCLYGDCATCMTDLLAGKVEYNHPTAVQPEASACLPCSCRPKGSITLNA